MCLLDVLLSSEAASAWLKVWLWAAVRRGRTELIKPEPDPRAALGDHLHQSSNQKLVQI